MRLLVFCEAPADFRTTSALVVRMLHEEGPAWVADLLPSHPEAVFQWANDGPGKDFFDLRYTPKTNGPS